LPYSASKSQQLQAALRGAKASGLQLMDSGWISHSALHERRKRHFAFNAAFELARRRYGPSGAVVIWYQTL
jgi:hypothetical protein